MLWLSGVWTAGVVGFRRRLERSRPGFPLLLRIKWARQLVRVLCWRTSRWMRMRWQRKAHCVGLGAYARRPSLAGSLVNILGQQGACGRRLQDRTWRWQRQLHATLCRGGRCWLGPAAAAVVSDRDHSADAGPSHGQFRAHVRCDTPSAVRGAVCERAAGSGSARLCCRKAPGSDAPVQKCDIQGQRAGRARGSLSRASGLGAGWRC